jgi:hypothetical protein
MSLFGWINDHVVDNIGDLWRGVTHYGFNKDAWATDAEAQRALGGLGRTIGYGAAIAAPALLGGGSYMAGLGKIGGAAWNYGGKQAATALGTSMLSGSAPTQPQQPTGGGMDYNALAKQMMDNQYKQQRNAYRSQQGMRYGGAFGRW